jgi:hypothetical protein
MRTGARRREHKTARRTTNADDDHRLVEKRGRYQSGVGINLETNTPAPEALRNAVRRVLDTQTYRARASLMAEELARIDTRAEILRIVEQSSQNAVDSSCAAMTVPT